MCIQKVRVGKMKLYENDLDGEIVNYILEFFFEGSTIRSDDGEDDYSSISGVITLRVLDVNDEPQTIKEWTSLSEVSDDVPPHIYKKIKDLYKKDITEYRDYNVVDQNDIDADKAYDQWRDDQLTEDY
jgi:hypothetical protein